MNPYRTFFEAEGDRFGSKPLDLSSAFPNHPELRNYMIVIAGRCGSTWLGRMLQDLGVIGAPNEWFNTQGLAMMYQKRNATGLADYVQKTAALHPVFGVQINPERLLYLEELVDLTKTFASFAMIDLRRRDFAAQAFSFARARKSGQWHNVKGPPVDVSDEEVWAMIAYVIRNEQRIDKWYAAQGLTPMRLVYEDILADRNAVILRILAYLSRSKDKIPAYSPPLQHQHRNGDGSLDEGLLDFLRRHVDAVEQIHADRSQINDTTLLTHH